MIFVSVNGVESDSRLSSFKSTTRLARNGRSVTVEREPTMVAIVIELTTSHRFKKLRYGKRFDYYIIGIGFFDGKLSRLKVI